MNDMAPLTDVQNRVKLRVEDYLMLDAAGALEEHGRTELLNGEIYRMSPQHRPHARIKSRLHVALAAALQSLGSRLEALVEGSVSMPPYDVPEPDISLTDAAEGTGLAPISSIALVIEIGDSTLRRDMRRKLKLYAREGVAEYWVVNVQGAVIHQMWAPEGESYRERRDVAFGHAITAATVDGLTIDTSTL